MKKITIVFCLVIMHFSLLSQEGELDISFNGNGKFIHEDKSSDEQIFGVALQGDGKILIVGPSGNSGKSETYIFRLDNNGNPDPKFGSQGQVITDFGTDYTYGAAVAAQGDGKILIAGYAEEGDDNGVGLQRLMTDGTPDYSFGDSSIVFFPMDGFSHNFNYVGVQANGKIIVGGRYSDGGNRPVLLRFQSNGMPDYNFGDSAVAVIINPTSTIYAYKYVMKPTGEIVGVGETYVNSQQTFALVQFTTNGQPDVSFGSNGVLIINFTEKASARGVAVQADGKIVAVGYVEDGNSHDNFALARVFPDGTLDQNFGVNGKTSAALLNDDADASAVAILGDGKIIVAGTVDGIWNRDFAVARFSSTGKLDKSFSLDGYSTKNMGTGNDYVHNAVLQPNGRLVVVGSSYNTYNSGSSSSSYDFAAARFLAGENTFSEFENDLTEISVYPNPASSVLNIEMEDQFGDYELELVDVTGKICNQMSLIGSGTMEVSTLNSGLYILRVYKNGIPRGSRKVMVE
ncbi:hypothetical protein Oweho_0068 [Owenweeksia hongkongensis DSM 17368]|uniref:Secretion system C-terminal sorting domain-containing protein n=1 Tax=Owenweeksia hongkongensis (strain DSM 17368 / CIP 108786 / JCM 12287 / NRRL B-23963 / UST20020801) TaxID=926562 RepID=G8R5U4_OWEHD|nr:T9SS type A sorting domain-containing protein [Owenweeksia hongkongensis]AEV31092.1 hypothetical protein Oweho_0068 [Owenweeksia hongkongensis DSM 17368]